MTPIGPHSRPGKLALIDGRRAEARRMKEIKSELTEHVGGRPSAAQRMLIARIAALTLRLELMDREALSGKPETERDARSYLAWSNGLARMLQKLGLEAAVEGAYPLKRPTSRPFSREKIRCHEHS